MAQGPTLTLTDGTINGAPLTSQDSGKVRDALRRIAKNPTLNRVARHPAIRALVIALEEALMTQSEREIQTNALGVFLHPSSRQIAAEHDLTWGGMEGFNPFDADHWADDIAASSTYGAIATDAEKIDFANDVLTHAAGRPMDIRTTSAAEIDRILGGYAEMREEETRADAEVTDGNVRIEGQAEEIDCFNVPEDVDREEFERQSIRLLT